MSTFSKPMNLRIDGYEQSMSGKVTESQLSDRPVLRIRALPVLRSLGIRALRRTYSVDVQSPAGRWFSSPGAVISSIAHSIVILVNDSGKRIVRDRLPRNFPEDAIEFRAWVSVGSAELDIS